MNITCRLCLTNEGNIEDMFAIKGIDLPQKIFECTNVIIKKNQYLPSGICDICKTEIITWCKLKRQVINSNELLRTKYPSAFNNENCFGIEKETQTEYLFKNNITNTNDSYILECPFSSSLSSSLANVNGYNKNFSCNNNYANSFEQFSNMIEHITINPKLYSPDQLILELNLKPNSEREILNSNSTKEPETEAYNIKFDDPFNVKIESIKNKNTISNPLNKSSLITEPNLQILDNNGINLTTNENTNLNINESIKNDSNNLNFDQIPNSKINIEIDNVIMNQNHLTESSVNNSYSTYNKYNNNNNNNNNINNNYNFNNNNNKNNNNNNNISNNSNYNDINSNGNYNNDNINDINYNNSINNSNNTINNSNNKYNNNKVNNNINNINNCNKNKISSNENDMFSIEIDKNNLESMKISAINFINIIDEIGIDEEKICNQTNLIKETGDSDNESRCSISSKYDTEVFKTIRGKRVIYSYKCNVCGQLQTNIKQHMLVHTNELPYKCTFEGCDRKFRQKQNLKRHINMHNGTKPFKCKIKNCGRNFTDSAALRSHMVLHTGDRNYQCDICKRAFGWGHTLAQHRKIHEVNRERSYSCEYCNREFFAKNNLLKHLRLFHINENKLNKHKCENIINNVKQKINTSYSESTFECNYCHEKFRYSSVLKAHIEKNHLRFEQTMENNDISKYSTIDEETSKDSNREIEETSSSLENLQDESLENFLMRF